MTGEERRGLIVSTAFDLFARNGFRGTTTRELAHAVGVSEPVLYQHFSNKRELYCAIVQHLVEEGIARYGNQLEIVLAETEKEKFFTSLGLLIMSWYMDDSRLVRLLTFSALEGHELAEMWHDQAFTTFFNPVIERVGRMSAAGQLIDMEPEILARSFIGMVGHYGMMTEVFHYGAFALSREDVVARFVKVFLSGASRR
jgi:TetR/AcrR family transcriptional regulator